MLEIAVVVNDTIVGTEISFSKAIGFGNGARESADMSQGYEFLYEALDSNYDVVRRK